MKLYHFPRSPNTRKVLAVIYHLELNTKMETVDLLKGEQMKPEFVRLNPNHKTPALQDGDFLLWNRMPSCSLASRKPGNKLWPSDSKVQADISR